MGWSLKDSATHLCPIKTGAGGLISEDWCIDTFAEKLATLPSDLSEEQIIRPEFLLWGNGPLSVNTALKLTPCHRLKIDPPPGATVTQRRQ